ncbi:hypothetical protein KCP75_15640 [Salmonella enterica subsp. enterica]|nr:hypothetical protein KCP75_15640 [Salmonella enterica subsp. enterica]
MRPLAKRASGVRTISGHGASNDKGIAIARFNAGIGTPSRRPSSPAAGRSLSSSKRNNCPR